MNNSYTWNDVKFSILGKEIDVEPLKHDNRGSSLKYEGNIEIFTEVYPRLIPKVHKISNYQRKKLWKRFCNRFGIDYNKINASELPKFEINIK